ncbi:MAG: efflux RND transporter periplasmic adaptor subunit [Beijerinckiaceae bacterium]
MKRIFAIVAALATVVALGGLVSQMSPTARTILPSKGVPQFANKASATAGPSPAKGALVLPESQGVADKAPEGLIRMPTERIAAQEIEVAPIKKGVLARRLAVPGTITLNMDLVARVPARVVGTVTQLRKRLGDSVTQGEVVAVLDSREVADARSEYLTASVAFELQTTLLERVQTLWAKRFTPEQRYLQARESFQQAELRLDLARQKLSALNLDPAEVVKTAKQESAATSGVSTLREYQIRSLIGGRVIERKVDVGSLVGSQGDPADLYTIADLSVVWVELAVPTADIDVIAEGQAVVIASGGDGGKRGDGRIIFISPLVNPDTRSARVIARIDNKALIWRPGSAVTAGIVIEEEPVEVSILPSALQTIGGERVVFVRTPDGFQKRTVTTGRSDDQAVEITSGVTAGEQIAVKNTFLLKAELGKGEAGEGE